MANGCTNGKLNDAKYSSPVPLVGLYIAASSLLCLLFMLLDIGTAFRQRKRWIPCRLFSLNSVTLTLLSVCAKLPVDLTTSMPSAQDQLAKLSATTLVCISMGFFNPSLGDSSDFECMTNMVALSILVVTIVVNVCIQISTGMIYTFVKEHIIIMCCMIVSLVGLWYSALFVNSLKGSSLPYCKKLIIKGEGSMLQRLKLSYLYGFASNAQLKISRGVYNISVAGLCSVCFVILVNATLRSLILKQIKFCGGVSDYDWSIWMIVTAQILTVTIGCLATIFRWVKMSNRVLPATPCMGVIYRPSNSMLESRLFWNARSSWEKYFGPLLKTLFGVIILFPYLFVLILTEFFSTIFGSSVPHEYEEEDDVQEYEHLIGEGKRKLDGWVVWKAAVDMNKWMEASKREPPKSLFQFISRTKPLQHLHTMEFVSGTSFNYEGIEVSSFSLAILVRVATLSIPQRLTQSLERTFGEAYELIKFVEARIFTVSLKKHKPYLARALLQGDGFIACLPEIIESSTYGDAEFDSLSELNRACVIIKELKNTLGDDKIWKEVSSITDLIGRQEYITIEDLYNRVEQIFVDMLHLFFVQLPNAIFKYVNESRAEEFEKRVRVALKFLFMIEPLEGQVQWSFPTGSTISSLMITPLNDILEGDTDLGGNTLLSPVEDDVISQVV